LFQAWLRNPGLISDLDEIAGPLYEIGFIIEFFAELSFIFEFSALINALSAHKFSAPEVDSIIFVILGAEFGILSPVLSGPEMRPSFFALFENSFMNISGLASRYSHPVRFICARINLPKIRTQSKLRDPAIVKSSTFCGASYSK